MKEFEKWLWHTKHANFTWEEDARDAWREVLKHFNKLFLKGMHPQDVMFAMQKELEEK